MSRTAILRQPPPLLPMLESLIGTLSVSSTNPELDRGNLPLVELLAGWLEGAGFRVEILELPGHPGKANLLATLGEELGEEGPGGLVLAGHTDTVPYDADRWTFDPLRVTESDGRWHGLGMSDMKSFFALALEAARGLAAADLRQPLRILATADEESAMHGARALAAAGRPLGRHALIGEPTGLRPVRLHKGVMGEAVRLVGRSGHASDPALGNSALDGMHEAMTAILAWRETLRERYSHPGFQVPWPTVNLGRIQGGDNANRICGDCELHLDLRLLPGLAPETLRGELSELVAAVAARRGLEWSVTPLFQSIPPAETSAAAAIVRACEELSGQPAGAVNFGTEMPFFNRLGLETVILGPGDIAQAHQPDEYLAIDRVQPMIELLRGLIGRFCRSASPSGDGLTGTAASAASKTCRHPG